MVPNPADLLRSELKTLQELAGSLQPGTGSGKQLSPDIQALRNAFGKEADRVKEVVTKAIFAQARENMAERYLQFHQAGIIQLADQLQSHLPEGNDPELQLATAFFISQLFELLNYIERYFSKYFNLDAVIPEPYRLVALKQLSEPISSVLSAISARLQVQALKACLTDYLQSFCDENAPHPVSYRGLIYLKSFLEETGRVFRRKDIADWDVQLPATLVYLNFNHLGFFTYYQDSIRTELENTATREQYLASLSGSLTRVKGLQSKPAVAYHPAWPNIKTMLETWLSDEIAMSVLQRERGPVRSPPEQDIPPEKIVLNLSVAQIACFTRLLYEENCYATSSVTDILRFTARHFRSKRQEHISPGSLSKEYYGVSQVTAAMVLDLLQKMSARINKTYFPVWAAIGAAGFALT